MTTQPNFIQEALDIITALGQNYRVSRLRFQLGGPGQVDLIMVTEPIKDNPVPLGEIPQHTRDWVSGAITLSTWDYSETGVQSLISRNRAFEHTTGTTSTTSASGDKASGNDNSTLPEKSGQIQDIAISEANTDHKYHATNPDKTSSGEPAAQGPEAKRARGSSGRGFGGDNSWKRDLNTPECSESKDYENIMPPGSPLTPGADGWDTQSNLGEWSHDNPDISKKPVDPNAGLFVVTTLSAQYSGVGRGKNSHAMSWVEQPPAAGARGRDPIIAAAQAEGTEEGVPTFIVTGQDERAITAQAVMTPRVSAMTQSCQDEIATAEATVPLGLDKRALADQLQLDAVSVF